LQNRESDFPQSLLIIPTANFCAANKYGESVIVPTHARPGPRLPEKTKISKEGKSLSSSNLRTLVAACCAITVFGLAFGMTYPLLSLMLEERGVPANVIGLNSAMMPLGILIFSPLIPKFSFHLGSKRLAIVAALMTGVCILGYKVFDNLGAWFVIRLLQGMSIATLFVLSEAWIVGSSSKEHRGKIVAIYASVLSASFGIGPAMIGFIGTEGWLPFIIGASCIVIGVIPIGIIREVDKDPEQHNSSILGFLPKAPMLVAAVCCFSVFDAATLALLPVYGVENGLSQSTAAFALTALIIGNVFLQYPIGWLADVYDARKVLTWCAVVTVLLTVTVPWIINAWLLWPVLIVAGAAGYGVYTVSLKSLGDRFSGQELVNGTAAFGAMWGFGALFGSISGGWTMTLSSRYGLPFGLTVVYLLLIAGLLLRKPAAAS